MRIALAAVLFGISAYVLADQERTPVPIVFSSQFNEYYFRLIPGPFPYSYEKARGEMYRVAADKDELMYATAGWYSFNVLVSINGESLARFGDGIWGAAPGSQTLAIAFYNKGVLSSQYMLSDLVENFECLSRGTFTYSWSEPLRWGFNARGEIAELKTYDGQSIVFELKTGRILEKRRTTVGCSGPGTSGR